MTRVEIDYGDGLGWKTVATGSTAELIGTKIYMYTVKKTYYPKVRATDSNGYIDTQNGPSITVQ